MTEKEIKTLTLDEKIAKAVIAETIFCEKCTAKIPKYLVDKTYNWVMYRGECKHFNMREIVPTNGYGIKRGSDK